MEANTYYLDVYARNPSGLDAIPIITSRKIVSSCYSKCYTKALNILKDNGFLLSNVFIIITQEPY